MNLKELKVVFAGCAKNCANYLPKTLENIQIYSKLFKETFTIIIENGSTDLTKEILKTYKKQNDLFLFQDNLNKINNRTQRLELARNLIIEKIKTQTELFSCDLLIILDLDEIGAYKIHDQNILESINFLYSKKDIGAIFANQEGTYYDIWALRDERYCKTDFWVDILKFLFLNKKADKNIPSSLIYEANKKIINSRILSFKKDLPPILVSSAFGGFGIYKMEYILKNKKQYKGSQWIDLVSEDNKTFKIEYQKCEHVDFHRGLIDQNLKLYILPNLINRGFGRNRFSATIATNLIIKKN